MFYVYIIQSVNHAQEKYIGYTNNLNRRLSEHNSGYCNYTSSFKPWQLTTYIAFQSAEKAIAFEKYLKTSTGKNLVNKKFL